MNKGDMRRLFLVTVIVVLMVALAAFSFRDMSLSPEYSLEKEVDSFAKDGGYLSGKDSEEGVRSVGLDGCYVCDVQALNGATCHGDVDGNGVVNAGDRGFISANIGQTDNDLICLYDLDGNGLVNAGDRGIVSANIGSCSPLPNWQNGLGLNPSGVTDMRFGEGCAVCGNILCQEDLGEDESNCREDCVEEFVCGDFICEESLGENELNCPGDCFAAEPFCGNGEVDVGAGEQCDDGNSANNDGCSSTCLSVFGSAQVITNLVLDPSGIEWHPQIGKLIAIDNGRGKIYKMNSDGTNLQQVATGLGDLEGLAIADYSSQFVYVSPEVPQQIKEVNINTGQTNAVWSITFPGENNGVDPGIEALAFVPDTGTYGGVFYIGSQESGKIYKFRLPINGQGGSVIYEGVIGAFNGRSDLSIMYYDRENEMMYVGWDANNRIAAVRNIQTISDLDGSVYYEWILNFGTVGEEGFAFANGFAYICQDDNNAATYMIKKFPFAGITV